VCDGIDEAVVMFIPADFANEEARVENQANNNREKSSKAEENQNALTPVEDDPANVQGDSRDQANG